jgi:hypothetical protein
MRPVTAGAVDSLGDSLLMKPETAFGYYGMAWSLYSTLIARGAEVQFRKNAMVDVRFNTRPEPGATQGPANAN